MKRIKRIILFILAVGAIIPITGCGQVYTTTKNYSKTPVTRINRTQAKYNELCLVSFYTQGETIIPEQLVEKGSNISIPTIPSKEYYTFEGWKIKNGSDETVDLENYVVTEDVTFEAMWEYNGKPNSNNDNNKQETSNTCYLYVSLNSIGRDALFVSVTIDDVIKKANNSFVTCKTGTTHTVLAKSTLSTDTVGSIYIFKGWKNTKTGEIVSNSLSYTFVIEENTYLGPVYEETSFYDYYFN